MYGFECASALYQVINDQFPPVQQTVFYGSKVFPQTISSYPPSSAGVSEKNESPKSWMDRLRQQLNRSMVDCVLVVNDPQKWHAKNLLLNRDHYSLLMRYCGYKTIAALQNVGGGVIYHPYIDINTELQMKYGVISTSQLISDLLHWSSCFMAGRLHKPVLIINTDECQIPCPINVGNLPQKLDDVYKQCHDQQQASPSVTLADAMLLNWDYAARIALLLLLCQKQHRFSMDDVLHYIVSISYMGDDRMRFGEDRQKIDKIVNGSKTRLMEIYEPILRQYIQPCTDDTTMFECQPDTDINVLMSRLPKTLMQEIDTYDRSLRVVKDDRPRYDEWLEIALQHSMRKIIKRSSRKQVAKSFLTTDWNKIGLYFAQKIYKQTQSGTYC